jgi:hypothetical protein
VATPISSLHGPTRKADSAQFIVMFIGDEPHLRNWWACAAIVRRKALTAVLGALLLMTAIPALAQQEPGGTTGLPNIEVNPIPTTSGTLGLFTLETGEVLESGWSAGH